MPNQLELKKHEYEFYNLHGDQKKLILKHFQVEGCNRSSVYKYINNAEQEKSICRKKENGRKPKFNTSIIRQKVFKLFNHKQKISLSKMSKKLGCSRSAIRNILKDSKKPILNYKRKKRPNRISLQHLLALQKCQRLLQIL